MEDTEHGHVVSPDDEDAIVLEQNELGESFIAVLGDEGVYFDHNWSEGALHVDYDDLERILDTRDTTTMDDMYGDGSDHEACEECYSCIDCGDCECRNT